MAQMAFLVSARSLPFLDFGFADGETFIGIKTSNLVKVFRIFSSGETVLMAMLHTSKPFTIKDDPILAQLVKEKVDLEINGFQNISGNLSVEFKIYNGNDDLVYEENKSAAVTGVSHGGWSIYSKELNLIYPGASDGEAVAIQMGLLDKDEVRLSKEPDYFGLWEVQANYQTFYYLFMSGGHVKWFYQLPKTRLYNASSDGRGKWEIKPYHQLQIEWDSGSIEKWGMPLSQQNQSGHWYPNAGGTYQISAKRMHTPE